MIDQPVTAYWGGGWNTVDCEVVELLSQEERERFRKIGPGLQGGVLPFYEHVLVPGTGLGDASLVRLPGKNRWRTYWREEEVDTL